MIATGREPTLSPDLEGDACASPALEDPASYVEAVKKRLTLTHQQMTPPPAPVATNPYCEGSLIFAMTTPPECSNKLAPRWKGPFLVKRVPNPYQVTYEDGSVWRTIHVNHAKPAKTPADGFPAPLPTPEPPKPTLGCLPKSLQRPLSRRPLPPPQPAAPTAGPPHPAAAQPAATPPSSRPSTRSAANRNSAPRAGQQPPTASGRANENSRPDQPLRRSARLTPRACAIKSHPQPAAPQLRSDHKMARTYPLSLKYGQCLGHEEDPYTFSSLFLENLHSGRKEYLANTFHESRLCWIHDSTPSPPRRMERTFPVPPSDSSAPIPSDSVRSHNAKVSVRKNSDNQASAIATRGSSGAPLTPSLPKKCRRRRRRQARRAANRNAAPSSAAPVTPDERWANQSTGRPGATQPLLEDSDPTSRMRTAEYPHSQIVGKHLISAANENSPFHLGLGSGEFPGLYKPAVPDQRQDSTARPFRVRNSGSGISSPPYLQPYTKPFSGRPARPYMTCPTREAGGALRRGLESSTHCCRAPNAQTPTLS